MTLKMRLLGGLVIVSMLFAASCAQGVDDETFTAGVTNAQLESPAAESMSYALVADASGTELMKISWPVVVGAGGYLCNVWNVNEPENPVQVVENEVVDGASILFAFVEDSDYLISVQTLGNKALNNAGADTATEKKFSAKTPGITIPAGTPDVGAFINNYMTEHADELAEARKADSNFEIAFDLEPGEAYTMSTVADFGVQPARVRGDRAERPIITITDNAYFMTAGGLRMKFLNIDAAGVGKQDTGLITMHQDPPTETKLGSNSYMCEKPIRIESCWIKDLPRALFTFGVKQWGVNELRVTDCIIQCNNSGTGAHKTLIYGYCNASGNFPGEDKWYGGIFNTYVTNSTIYNKYNPAEVSKSAYGFIRFSNQDLSKVFGSYNGVLTIRDCTICRMSAHKEAHFGNNMPNKTGFVITFANTNFWHSHLLQKVKRGATYVWENNTVWSPNNDVNDTDKTEIAKEENQGFTDDNLNKSIDFSQPNGGVNFKATGAVSSTIGDPRWL